MGKVVCGCNVSPEMVLILPHRSSSTKVSDIMAQTDKTKQTNQMNMGMGPWKVRSALQVLECSIDFSMTVQVSFY